MESRASSFVVVWGFHSCCGRVLLLNSGEVRSSWESFGIASGVLGLILTFNGVPLESLHVNWTSSRVEAGNLGYFESFGGKHVVPLKLQQGSWCSSLVATGESGLLSGCGGKLRLPLRR